VVEDLVEVIHVARATHPDVPVVLMGHSMGSTVGVSCLAEHPGLVDAAILSGPVGCPPPLVYVGKVVARVERLRLGRRGRSALLMKMSFGDFNKPFEPARTAFDWLSRDPVEVDKYIDDPHCGFDVTTQNWIDHLHGISKLRKLPFLARIPSHLPIFVIAGTQDPVGDGTKQLVAFLSLLGEAGLQDIEHRFWDGGRHELLNDTVRDEVTDALVAWLDKKISRD
jgi:alpha-beta hydrolase superfamily lysophospholipase